MLDRLSIAKLLKEIAARLELKGDSYFQARAYSKGARVVSALSEDIGTLVETEGRLKQVPGIGPGLAAQIKELYLTGSSSYLERLRNELPNGVLELSQVPSLSLSKIEQLHGQLGITTIAELKAACEQGKVREIKGFGLKTEKKILDGLLRYENRDERILLLEALKIGEEILSHMRACSELGRIEIAGSLRRWNETVSNIPVVATSKNSPTPVLDHFLRFPLITRVDMRAPNKCSVLLADGVKASLAVPAEADYWITLHEETGSGAYIENIEKVALGKGLKITASSRGQVNRPGRFCPKSEADIFRRLDMQYIPPELRDGEGEIEAALKGQLPKDLIELNAIQGMVHCHTTYSDGKNSIEEMALAAEAMGMKYITITDHSPTAFYAGGLKLDRLKKQWDEIDAVQDKVKIKLLKGTESDILGDGKLDYPDRILEKFDVIIASIHSRMKMDEDQMTRRIVGAMKQPVFKIWGHALGRLIGRRPPFACRVEEVLDVVAASRSAIEINGDPHRLDMEPRWIKEARKRKIKFVISTDAHSVAALNYLKFGVGIARHGWVRRGEVLNTLGARAFQTAVRPA